MRGAPCTPECEDRSPTCHSECEGYLEYAKMCEEVRQNRKRRLQTRNDVFHANNWKGRRGKQKGRL